MSSRHSNPVTVPLSVPENVKLIEADWVVPPLAMEFPRPSIAPVIVVSGGVFTGGALTVQLNRAGVSSGLLDVSTARTSNVWLPMPRLL